MKSKTIIHLECDQWICWRLMEWGSPTWTIYSFKAVQPNLIMIQKQTFCSHGLLFNIMTSDQRQPHLLSFSITCLNFYRRNIWGLNTIKDWRGERKSFVQRPINGLTFGCVSTQQNPLNKDSKRLEPTSLMGRKKWSKTNVKFWI